MVEVDVPLSIEIAALVPGLRAPDAPAPALAIDIVAPEHEPTPPQEDVPAPTPAPTPAPVPATTPAPAPTLAPAPPRAVPAHVVVCVSTAASAYDYAREQPLFAAGDVRWSGTQAGQEVVGDRFAFINAKADVMEVFEIVAIHGPEEYAAWKRPHWGQWHRVLVMGPKLGEARFSKMHEVFYGKYARSPQSISRWRWSAAMEAAIVP